MSQKPSIDLAIWQWALIGAGSTMVLALAGYGAFSLISSTSATSNNCSASVSNPIAIASSPLPKENLNQTSSNSSPQQDLSFSPPNSFRNQATKARQSEAKTYTGSMNRGQQAFNLEKNRFASNLDELAMGIKAETESYSYRVSARNDPNPLRRVTFQIGQSKNSELKSYVGAVRIAKPRGSADSTSLAFLCEASSPGTSEPPLPLMVGDETMQCAPGTFAIQ